MDFSNRSKINDRLAMETRSFLGSFPVRATGGEVLQHSGPTPIYGQDVLCFGLIAPKAHLQSSAKDGPRYVRFSAVRGHADFGQFWDFRNFLNFRWRKIGASPSIQKLPLALELQLG